MKSLKYSLSAAAVLTAAAITLSSCVQKEISGDGSATESVTVIGESESLLPTRTAVDLDPTIDGSQGILWSVEDKLGVFGNKTVNSPFSGTFTSAVSTGTFSGKVIEGDSPKYAYYPYDEAADNVTDIKVTISSEQTYTGPESIGLNDIKASGTVISDRAGYRFVFKPMVSLLGFNVRYSSLGGQLSSSEKLEGIVLKTKGDKAGALTGNFTMNLTDLSSGLSEVTGETSPELKLNLKDAAGNGKPLSGSVAAYASIFPGLKAGDPVEVQLMTDKHIVSFEMKALNDFKAGAFYEIDLDLNTLKDITVTANGDPGPGTGHSFTTGDKTFLLDGEPFIVKAAELHYPRIPRPYWENRIQLCKALGMNTICLYVFWNIHEQSRDNFDFSGQNDLAEFCRLCQKNGMYVILRPGPYVCAEWDMGGLPWWLLKQSGIRLRDNDDYFLERVDKFEQAVAGQLEGMTIQKGGPILMIQVENEYGSYGENKTYVGKIRDILRKYYGNEVQLFQCDWSSNFKKNGLDDLLWTMNFGTGSNIDKEFSELKKVRPNSPLMCSEFWSGWYDSWGVAHQTRSAKEMTSGIDEMLSKGISFSLYMTHGGTNWGHWAGANDKSYKPDVTSYDYDAPISESGQITEKYTALRNTLSKYTNGAALPDIPETIPSGTLSEITFNEYSPLWDNLPASVGSSSDPMRMEDLDQGYGSVLYRTTLPEIDKSSIYSYKLYLTVHDYARVFVDNKLVGTIDRRKGETSISMDKSVLNKGARLDILVEAMGRVNFGTTITDYKGILGNVNLKTTWGAKNYLLQNWETYKFPDEYDFYKSMNYQTLANSSASTDSRLPAGCYKAIFTVTGKPTDTFLDFTSWGKGLVYVNGCGIGRIWEIGPQQTLYMPGCWLNEGENEIIVFDIIGPRAAKTQGLSSPILNKLQSFNY